MAEKITTTLGKRIPVQAYIRRNQEMIRLPVRIPLEVKEEAEQLARGLKTSLARYVEAALVWYGNEVKKKKSAS